nr:sodium-dependent multivitamin transporter-like [Parasteatoda tepidariorum]
MGEGSMELRHYLSVADYAVITVFLLLSAAIGIKFRLSGNRQQTVQEYLFAGKNMSTLPVVLSITATLTATGTMISTPAEVYRYGIQYVIMSFGTAFGMYLSSHLYVPVYFQCGVSTAYELQGGLKAVLWTDVLQAMLMYTCVIAFLSAGTVDTGGVSKIYERAVEGKRTNLFKALQISILPILLLHVMCNLAGLMLPYYIVNRFSSYPGLTGLCFSGIFSGSLSTVSSALNSLSTVTVVDYIQPLFPGMTESKKVFLAKLSCFLYGILGIGITFIFLNVQSLKQFFTSISVYDGSILAVFLIGILTRKADDNCIIFGTVLSVPIIA